MRKLKIFCSGDTIFFIEHPVRQIVKLLLHSGNINAWQGQNQLIQRGGEPEKSNQGQKKLKSLHKIMANFVVIQTIYLVCQK